MTGLTVSLVAAAVVAQSVGVTPRWQTDYGTALRAAQQSRRPLLVVLENPKNPAQAVGKEALTNGHGRPELLKKFELCHVDVTTRTGKLVAEAFGARQLPYTAITDEYCRKIVDRHVGRPTAGKWIAMLAARVRRPVVAAPLFPGLLSPESCFT